MEIVQPGKLFETSWSDAWAFGSYKRKFLAASILFGIILLYYPVFFAFIQQRSGRALHDPVLNMLPSHNMSVYIFSIIYVTVGLGMARAIQSPSLFLLFLWSCLFLSLSRIITITLVPLEPPVGLVQLTDPLLVPFYGHNHITKDLFYSGHTGSVFLVFLILKNKSEKLLALAATFLVAILLLIQHIHYTIDVLCAPLFVYLVFILAKKVANVRSADVG